MTQLINQAYFEIKHAPLRYYIGAGPLAQEGSGDSSCPPTIDLINKNRRTAPKTDKLEFWVRFVCGALFGAFVSFRLLMDLFERPTILVVAIATALFGFGFATAKYGDRFWYSILRHWWFWS